MKRNRQNILKYPHTTSGGVLFLYQRSGAVGGDSMVVGFNEEGCNAVSVLILAGG